VGLRFTCQELTEQDRAGDNHQSLGEDTTADERPPIRQLSAPELKALIELIWEAAGLGRNQIPASVHQDDTVYVMSGFIAPNLMAIRVSLPKIRYLL